TLLSQPAADKAEIAVDFSEAMDPSTGSQVANYAIGADGLPGLRIISVTYADSGGQHRATIKAGESGGGPIYGGTYTVRVHGDQLRSAAGIAMEGAHDNGLVLVNGANSVVAVGLQGDNSVGPGQVSSLGYNPSSFVARDFNGDGIVDLVVASAG